MSYGDRDLGQHWLRQWLDAWRHHAITWTNVDLWSVRCCGIHQIAISQENTKIFIVEMSLKIYWFETVVKFPRGQWVNPVNAGPVYAQDVKFVITIPAEDLAFNGARASSGTVLTIKLDMSYSKFLSQSLISYQLYNACRHNGRWDLGWFGGTSKQ